MSVDTAANVATQILLDRLVDEGREIGVQVAAYHGDHLIVDASAGLSDLAARRKVDGGTLFNAFSVAKAVTATAVHIQAERELLEYDAPLRSYWPEFAGRGREKITVRHVLTHRSGMARMPSDVTVAQICDWDYMIRVLEATTPVFEPGSRSGYQSMTYGWLLGEVVRRTDLKGRDFRDFVRDEIAKPLGIADLWLGIPETEQCRVATIYDSAVSVAPANSPYRETMPIQIDLMAETYGRPDVRRACIPAVGAIFTARAVARFFAMLANGGTLDGVRLLSEERVAGFSRPRDGYGDTDIYSGRILPLGIGGFQLGGTLAPSAYAPRNPRALCFPGMGGSLGAADPETHLAIGFCHNRLSDFVASEEDTRAQVFRVIEKSIAHDREEP